ncbi:hypothetical protein [Spirosoma endbachense]|uniref:Uncharacterized protein n=1 Tax=Spirosoma endbachense TaxID=2666025 RepID=A0A6P1VVB4_9BACT|nr:hypothetical protein [Spirosoma endbachense]QHV96675.1 hypothetical protein GJR95_17390 [Spirosoma endbachense]
MDYHIEKPIFSNSGLLISLLVGIGAIVCYTYCWSFLKKQGLPPMLDSDYRLDWLGI